MRLLKCVEKELACSAHDIEHVMRVYNLCLLLSADEDDIDLDVLKSAAILHDIARVKEDSNKSGRIDHAILGAKVAKKLLAKNGYSEEKIEKIAHCIEAHRLRGTIKPKTKEAKILYDADKVDVLGAVGIARCFALGGRYGQRLYAKANLRKYIKENTISGSGRIKDISKHTPNLEYELKLKHIPKMLYTKKAKKIASKRMQIMKKFFSQMKQEIEGKI
ncbi:MAG: HD domain-containing protein [Candidatus Diapherotrites archaeon]|nr:HD domain-containing protein [Candidatus Diapherotrites archaeon]